MAKAETERQVYERLKTQFEGKPDDDLDDDDDDDEEEDEDDGGIFMLTGRRADAFLEGLFGGGKKKTKKKPEPEPDDEEDGDEEDGDEDVTDEPPARGHGYFRQRGSRG